VNAPAPLHPWRLVFAAAAILGITMGARLSLGLFIAPLHDATAIGIAGISFALAINQLVWGAAQPLWGALADRQGTRAVIAAGALLTCAGMALTPYVRSETTLVLALGVLAAAGAAASSFSILIGSIADRLPSAHRALASGIVNAGSSAGQFLFAPVLQLLIGGVGWVATLLLVAASALATIPLAAPLERHAPAPHPEALGLGPQLRVAFSDPNYMLLHLGFFTCGFHIAFLVTHLPGQVQMCGLGAQVSANSLALIGLFNIMGSIAAGAACQRWRMKYVLAAMYASRTVLILAFLAAPKTTLTFYVFAGALGATWLATVPPTAGLVGKLFGTRHLATLFGLTLFSHQIGGFFGAWLGGVALLRFGDYSSMWYADAALAAAAAILNLPIKEARLEPRPAAG
jgi:predicted MFS family arabinose efflux permease